MQENCITWQAQLHVLEGKYLNKSKQSLIRLFSIRLESLDFRLQKRCFTTIEKSVLNCRCCLSGLITQLQRSLDCLINIDRSL